MYIFSATYLLLVHPPFPYYISTDLQANKKTFVTKEKRENRCYTHHSYNRCRRQHQLTEGKRWGKGKWDMCLCRQHWCVLQIQECCVVFHEQECCDKYFLIIMFFKCNHWSFEDASYKLQNVYFKDLFQQPFSLLQMPVGVCENNVGILSMS